MKESIDKELMVAGQCLNVKWKNTIVSRSLKSSVLKKLLNTWILNTASTGEKTSKESTSLTTGNRFWNSCKIMKFSYISEKTLLHTMRLKRWTLNSLDVYLRVPLNYLNLVSSTTSIHQTWWCFSTLTTRETSFL
mgnify:CR=1 FL=1